MNVKIFIKNIYIIVLFTGSIQNLLLLDQVEINTMVLGSFLKVQDLGMKLIVEENLLIKLAEHLKPQDAGEVKAKSACLIYGHPGAGKTRFFRDLTAALSGTGSRELYDRLSSQLNARHINIDQVTVAAVTFNTVVYRCTSQDARLCIARADLPVALRLFFAYFQHGYSRNSEGFDKMRIDLLRLSAEEDGALLEHFTVQALLKEILRGSTGKKHLLLLIDETLALRKELQHLQNDDQFIEFMSCLNKLQDAASGNLLGGKSCFSVIYSGLLDGPWVKEASISKRQLKKYLLSPLPPTSDAFGMIVDTEGFQELSQHYTLIRGKTAHQIQVRDALAQYMFCCCAGLPRAVEVLRRAIRERRPNDGVRDVLRNTAALLQDKYELLADAETLCLALMGRAIDGSKEENKPYVTRLHTYMSEGKCMLLTVRNEFGIIEDGNVRVDIPPLRLQGDGYSGSKELSQLVTLTSEMSEKIFELFLVRHEAIMRIARKGIVDNKLNSLFQSPYCNVDLSSATLQELYFGVPDAKDNDIKVEWRDESVRKARFDFTTPLQIKSMKSLPHFSSAHHFEDSIIVSSDPMQKGFEYAVILRTQEAVPRMIVLVVQAKFTKAETVQEADEVVQTAVKCKEVTKKLGWPEENVIVLFQTNRKKRDYKTTVKQHNLILMCGNRLESYMGPTVWGLLQSCHCLANLELGVSESAQQSAAEEKGLPPTSTAAQKHK